MNAVTIFFSIEVALIFFINIYDSISITLKYTLLIGFLTITVLTFKDYLQEELQNIEYLLSFVYTFLFYVLSLDLIYMNNKSPDPATKTEIPIYSLILLLLILLPIPFLYYFFKLRKKRIRSEQIEKKSLNYLMIYYLILLGMALMLSFISFISFESSFVFPAIVEFTDIYDKLMVIINSILLDPILLIFVLFMVFGIVAKNFGNAGKMIGNIMLTFLPLLYWLFGFFGETPQEIIELFIGYEFFGWMFHKVLITSFLVIIVASLNVFSQLALMEGY